MFNLRVNLELYRIFYITAHTGSMTKAAEKLFVGQPAVSKAIKTLEQNFNTTLFHRTSKGIVLTEEGQAFYHHIANAMEQISLGEELLASKKKKVVKVEVCAMQYKRLILSHIKDFFDCCGNKDSFDISPTTDSVTSMKLLKEGKIDCCIVTKPPKDDAFTFIKLFTYHDYMMGEQEYVQSIVKNSQNLLNNAVFISIMNEGIMSYYEKMRLQNLQFSNKMKVTSMEHTISLTKLGCGIGFIAEELVEEELNNQEIVKIDLPYLQIPREVGFLLNKNQQDNSSVMNFIDFYRNIYPS